MRHAFSLHVVRSAQEQNSSAEEPRQRYRKDSMSIKVIALCAKPEDPKAFLEHYYAVHVPMVRKIPHLQQMSVREITSSPLGNAPYFLMNEMTYADQNSFEEAMKSPENKAVGEDAQSFAKGLLTLLIMHETETL